MALSVSMEKLFESCCIEKIFSVKNDTMVSRLIDFILRFNKPNSDLIISEIRDVQTRYEDSDSYWFEVKATDTTVTLFVICNNNCCYSFTDGLNASLLLI